MIIDQINLNHLRIFECVFRKGNMTAAARELHLTQSGVSQHIQSLEDALGIKLFDRVKQRLIPTHCALALFKECSDSFSRLEQVISAMKGDGVHLSGTVNIGMPMEFGNNLILPRLSKLGRLHPKIRFSFKYGFAAQMNSDLLNGHLDFAFVDGFEADKRLMTQSVYDEILLLCIHQKWIEGVVFEKESRSLFESLEYVDYHVGEPVLRMWFEHHFQSRTLELNIRATVMNVQGVARMILDGLAAGVLPSHLASKLIQEGHPLHCFAGCGRPLVNQISVAYLEERTLSPAAQQSMRWLIREFV